MEASADGASAVLDCPGAAGTSTAGLVSPVAEQPAAAALDLHEGIWERHRQSGCSRWPAGMRLMWRRGALFGFVRGRCRATNLCPYCRILGVVETAEMLYLDALEYAPTLLLTLTAREHLVRSDTYALLKEIRRRTRKQWPAIEWFVQVEFQKRGALHLHLLVKGVPADDAWQLKMRACDVWCARVDAAEVAQDCKPINAAQAVVRYLQKELAHGLKQEQAPPLGWRGHRTSQTRGYLVRPAAVMREEAKRSLQSKRALHAVLEQLPDAEPGLIEELVTWRLELDAAKLWSLVAEHHGSPQELVEGALRPLAQRHLAAWRSELEAGPSSPPGQVQVAPGARPSRGARASGADEVGTALALGPAPLPDGPTERGATATAPAALAPQPPPPRSAPPPD